ncbi:MAG TPA: site-2 protease family protein [Phycisphaerales bacterium]|nr:site-2 protease family protein [Phycisphaerales bacterium]
MLDKWWGMRIVHMYNDAFPSVASIGSVALAAWLTWVIVSICLHELGHGWAAIKCGDDTPRLLGHMTLDPMKHMGIVSFVMLAMVGITWGLMPVDPSRFRRRHDDALVALAGPAVNAVLCLVCLVGAALSLRFLSGDAMVYTYVVFTLGLQINLIGVIFNLMPIPPLDGSAVLASFVPALREFIRTPQAGIVGLFVMLIFGMQIIGPIIGWAASAARASIVYLVSLMGGP